MREYRGMTRALIHRFASLILVTAVVAFIVAVWRSQGLVFAGTSSSATVVAAVLVLIGTFMTAVVSVIALLVKYAIDRQTEARLSVESDRAQLLQHDAEERFKLEASIRAIQLLAGPSGEASLPVQRAGALITLSSLGQHVLVLTLLQTLLQRNEIDAMTATQMIDRALLSGNARVQTDATSLLETYAHRFVTDYGYEFPIALLTHECDLSVYSKRWAAIAVAKVIVARPLSEWNSHHRAALDGLIGNLCLFWKSESDENVRTDAGAVLYVILQAVGYDDVEIAVAQGVVDVTELRRATSRLVSRTREAFEMIDRVNAWATVSA
jgi:hypothetical protein